ncbi:MAG: hypothetical protein U0992_23340 [Planctomycetaceae bacterium]
MRQSNSYRRTAFWTLGTLGIAVIFAGCGNTQNSWEKVVPAEGVISFKGKPLAGALITLVPQDVSFPPSVRPNATSGPDGTFKLGTYSTADGAPAGEYKALVLHYPVVGSKKSPNAGPNDLPKKYSRPETTTLTVRVAEDSSKLQPLELK